MTETTTTVTGADVLSFVEFRRGANEGLFAVVDAARDRALAFSARDEFGLEARWLFNGPTPATQTATTPAASGGLPTLADQFKANVQSQMAPVAPYVVAVPIRGRDAQPGREYLDRWADRLGTSAGILLLAPVDLDALARHLRSIFHATDDQYHKFFFRFYDPRVLRTYLPTCTAAEAHEFFGSIHHFLIESERTGSMLAFRPGRSGVEVKEDALGPSAESGTRGRARR